MEKASVSRRDCPRCLCSTTYAHTTDLPSLVLMTCVMIMSIAIVVVIIVTSNTVGTMLITIVIVIITLVTFFSKVSCSTSAPCSKTVHPRGRGQPLKNMSVRGPVPPPYLDEPPEPCELPLLLNRRRGVDGVLGPLSVCRSCTAVEAVASILAVLSC